MTETERTSLINRIEDFYTWMQDSSGYNLSDTDITELVEDDSDVYEVFVIIHLTNGERITIRNHCFESFMSKRYVGDTIYYLAEGCLSTISKDDYVEINYIDDDGIFNQCAVTLSSICYIEGYNVSLNWLNLYEHIWKKRNGEYI